MGRIQGKDGKTENLETFQKYWSAYLHFRVRAHFDYIAQKHTQVSNSMHDASSLKLAATEIWFGNQKVSSDLSGSCRRFTKTVINSADIQKISYLNTNQGFFFSNYQTHKRIWKNQTGGIKEIGLVETQVQVLWLQVSLLRPFRHSYFFYNHFIFSSCLHFYFCNHGLWLSSIFLVLALFLIF